MIEVICPHCKNDIEITDDVTIYNLNRINESLHKCNCCEKTFLIYRDGDHIKTLRISKR